MGPFTVYSNVEASNTAEIDDAGESGSNRDTIIDPTEMVAKLFFTRFIFARGLLQ